MSRFLRAFLDAEAPPQKTCFSASPVPNKSEKAETPSEAREQEQNTPKGGGFSSFSSYSGQGLPKNAVLGDAASLLAASVHPPTLGLLGNADAAQPDEIETLALALMAEAERNPAQRITDPEKATLYYRGEAMRRLDLIRHRAIDATTGDDPEREAIVTEEAAVPTTRVMPITFTTGILRAASPLAGLPGAWPCRSCGRGIWVSPSWRGPQPPDLCAQCWRETDVERNTL